LMHGAPFPPQLGPTLTAVFQLPFTPPPAPSRFPVTPSHIPPSSFQFFPPRFFSLDFFSPLTRVSVLSMLVFWALYRPHDLRPSFSYFCNIHFVLFCVSRLYLIFIFFLFVPPFDKFCMVFLGSCPPTFFFELTL